MGWNVCLYMAMPAWLWEHITHKEESFLPLTIISLCWPLHLMRSLSFALGTHALANMPVTSPSSMSGRLITHSPLAPLVPAISLLQSPSNTLTHLSSLLPPGTGDSSPVPTLAQSFISPPSPPSLPVQCPLSTVSVSPCSFRSRLISPHHPFKGAMCPRTCSTSISTTWSSTSRTVPTPSFSPHKPNESSLLNQVHHRSPSPLISLMHPTAI